MNDLYRDLAPISLEAWALVDEEAQSTLKVALAGRQIADFTGPLGWDVSSIGIGRSEPLKTAPHEDVEASIRWTQPLIELKAPFTLSRSEVDAATRGAADVDLSAVRDAARAIAMAEDRAIFHGYEAGNIVGICEEAANEALTITEDYHAYPSVVAAALAKLRQAGVAGPYAIVLGPKCYTGLTRTTTAGFPVIQHVERLLDGPVIWGAAVDGAVVVSLGSGAFELTVGRDFSIGYRSHTEDELNLYIEESFTFRVLNEDAAVPLVYADEAKRGKPGKPE